MMSLVEELTQDTSSTFPIARILDGCAFAWMIPEVDHEPDVVGSELT
jgi:hypothetical protein